MGAERGNPVALGELCRACTRRWSNIRLISLLFSPNPADKSTIAVAYRLPLTLDTLAARMMPRGER